MHVDVDMGQSHTSASLAGLGPCFSKAKRLAFVGSCTFALASSAGMLQHCQVNEGSDMPSKRGMLYHAVRRLQCSGSATVQCVFLSAVKSSIG